MKIPVGLDLQTCLHPNIQESFMSTISARTPKEELPTPVPAAAAAVADPTLAPAAAPRAARAGVPARAALPPAGAAAPRGHRPAPGEEEARAVKVVRTRAAAERQAARLAAPAGRLGQAARPG